MLIPLGQAVPRTVSLPDHERPEAGAAAVIGLRVRGTNREYPLDPRGVAFSIGRAPGNDIVLDDPNSSGLHALLLRANQATGEPQDAGDSLLVYDKSKNGTYCNNVRVTRGYLSDGARLRIGTTTLVAFSEATRRRLTPLEYLVGDSDAFARARQMVLAIAATDAHAVITGEPGTGKRIAAQAIHQESARATGPFVAVDCDVLSAATVERELFGVTDCRGLVDAARGGTLLVHAIEQLPDEIVTTLGQLAADPALDVRIVVTARGVLEGRRYRWLLDQVRLVELPPLRERWQDIPALVDLFVHELSWPDGPRTISSTTLAALCGYRWPGNVRELRDAVRRSLAMSPGAELSFELLWPDRTTMSELLRRAVQTALEQHGSSRAAAEALGIPKSTLSDLIGRLGIARRPKA